VQVSVRRTGSKAWMRTSGAAECLDKAVAGLKDLCVFRERHGFGARSLVVFDVCWCFRDGDYEVLLPHHHAH
jgi:hypothetical protein